MQTLLSQAGSDDQILREIRFLKPIRFCAGAGLAEMIGTTGNIIFLDKKRFLEMIRFCAAGSDDRLLIEQCSRMNRFYANSAQPGWFR